MNAMLTVYPKKPLCVRSDMLYGHFIEHFHRQIYGGIFDPASPFADSGGFREDVLAAMKKLRVPVLRWPGGCFVSAYHWKKAVGPVRTPNFDKAWRVEDPNTFGTDEYIALCRRLGCAPYICTNAGTGCAEEMSDWLEYCNQTLGEYARLRAANGHPAPYGVKYWSIGNENYGSWEIGAKEADEWSRLVREAAKMMKRVDPTVELSAAAIPDAGWNLRLLERCAPWLDWISIHKYWDMTTEEDEPANYEQVMAFTNDLDADLRRVRGLLMALGLEKRIKIAYDEWNLRSWHHPNIMGATQGRTEAEYLAPRDRNDRNETYTMADAVFTACFLNTLNRNADLVGMANFSPIVNTRGCIYTHPGGIVLRGTYHVFDLYVNYLGETVLDSTQSVTEFEATGKTGKTETVSALDLLPTLRSDGLYCVAAVNKHPVEAALLDIDLGMGPGECRVISVAGEKDAYNDVDRTGVRLTEGPWQPFDPEKSLRLAPHSVSVVQIKFGET